MKFYLFFKKKPLISDSIKILLLLYVEQDVNKSHSLVTFYLCTEQKFLPSATAFVQHPDMLPL